MLLAKGAVGRSPGTAILCAKYDRKKRRVARDHDVFLFIVFHHHLLAGAEGRQTPCVCVRICVAKPTQNRCLLLPLLNADKSASGSHPLACARQAADIQQASPSPSTRRDKGEPKPEPEPEPGATAGSRAKSLAKSGVTNGGGGCGCSCGMTLRCCCSSSCDWCRARFRCCRSCRCCRRCCRKEKKKSCNESVIRSPLLAAVYRCTLSVPT